MAPKTRLTKVAVLEEIKTLRRQMETYFHMSGVDLVEEYYKVFTDQKERKGLTREYIIHQLLIVATYYITNVLGLE